MPTLLERPSVRQAAVAFTVAPCHRMAESGVISKKTELLQGEEYWLVLPRQRSVEVLTNPTPTGYANHHVYGENDVPTLQSLPDIEIDLSHVSA